MTFTIHNRYAELHIDAESEHYKIGVSYLREKWVSSRSTATCDREYAKLLAGLWTFIDAQNELPISFIEGTYSDTFELIKG